MNAKDTADKEYLEKVAPLIKSVLSGNGYVGIGEHMEERYDWMEGSPILVIDGELTADQLKRLKELL
jgi:hypothetical protein